MREISKDQIEGKKVKHSNGLKIFAAICFVLTIVSLVLIRNAPSPGYVLSPYSEVSPVVWVFLILSIAGGIAIICHQAFTNNKSNFWLVGFLLLVFNILVILLFPAFRGYFLYESGDSAAHLGFAWSILSTGSFGGDFYPISHLLIAQLSLICGISRATLALYIPALFSILFMVFLYLLARAVLSQRGQMLLVAAASVTLLYSVLHVSLYPMVQSIFLFPLIFYFYFRARESPSLGFRIPLIIFLLLFPFFYAPTAVVLIGFLIAAELVRVVYRVREKGMPFKVTAAEASVNPILICFIALFLWVSTFAVFGTSVSNILAWLHGEIPYAMTVQEVRLTGALQPFSGTQQFELWSKLYGADVIYAILALVALAIVVRRIYRHRVGDEKVPMLLGMFAIAMPLHLVIFATSGGMSVGRLLACNYLWWLTPPLVGFILWELLKGKRAILGIGVATALLSLCAIMAIFGLYRSPYVYQPSWHLTEMDKQGTQWFIAHTDPAIGTNCLGITLDTAARTVDPPIMAREVQTKWASNVPDNFGYDEHQWLGENLDEDEYMVLTKRFRIAATDPKLSQGMIAIPSEARVGFTEEGFNKLEQDQSCARLYTNGEFEVWYIESM